MLLVFLKISYVVLCMCVCVCVCVCVNNFKNILEIDIIYKNVVILEFSEKRILRLVHI